MPLYPLDGQRLYAIKPDTPLVSSAGKRHRAKYIFPNGHKHILEAPPRCRADLADVRVPLFVCEGAKKVDYIVQSGRCGLNIWGVSDWSYQTDQAHHSYAGLVLLSDWEYIALQGRVVYLVFDSDAWTKPSVGQSLRRLANKLYEPGADVRVVRLADDDDGSKLGIDDFGARHGEDAVARLIARAEIWRDDGSRRRQAEADLRAMPETIWTRADKDVALALTRQPHCRDDHFRVWLKQLCEMAGHPRRSVCRSLVKLEQRGCLWRHSKPVHIEEGFTTNGTDMRFTAGGPEAFLEQLISISDIDPPRHGGARPGNGRKLTPLVPRSNPQPGSGLANACVKQVGTHRYVALVSQPAAGEATLDGTPPPPRGSHESRPLSASQRPETNRLRASVCQLV